MRFLAARIVELTHGFFTKTAGYGGNFSFLKSNATNESFHSQMRSACQLESYQWGAFMAQTVIIDVQVFLFRKKAGGGDSGSDSAIFCLVSL